MSETYEIYTPDGSILKVEKDTNKILFLTRENKGKYTEQHSKALLEAWDIMQNSPYKDYKPIYLDPELKTGQSSTLLEFKQWQDLYLKDPVKGAIAPWTKAEKAYYQSLKTKRERYQYLVIRSGLRSAVIDIPYEAIGGVDEQGRVINPEYEEIFYEVDKNKETLKSYLFRQEWGIAAGILGNPKYFVRSKNHGFTARMIQCFILYLQLTGGGDEELGIKQGLYNYADNFLQFGLVGVHKNKIREQQVKDLAQSIKTDEFGMLPYIDEIMGVDWIIDLNTYQFAYDGRGNAIDGIYNDIKQSKLKDPRDVDSTSESRREFEIKLDSYRLGSRMNYASDISNDRSEESAELFDDTLILHAKLAALTPPQGYPNAPRYYSPERLEFIYKKGKLDKRLNPTIPAMYRYNFPEDLRKKIESYAKEHNIS